MSFEYVPLQQWNNIPSPNKLKINNPTQYRFCLDQQPDIQNQSFYSKNQALAVKPNRKAGLPRIHTPPPMPAKAMDPTYWGNGFTVPSGINRQTNTDLYLSGYLDPDEQFKPVPTFGEYVQTTWANPGYPPPLSVEILENGQEIGQDLAQKNVIENYQGPPKPQPNTMCEKIAYEQEQGYTNGDMLGPYYPEQTKYNLPVNLPVGRCEKQPALDEYNKNLFTQYAGENLFSRSEIIEPVQNNIGIDFTQQIPPSQCSKDQYGNRITEYKDPRNFVPEPPLEQAPESNLYNVYDPRSGGYGTSYRSYLEPMTGQVRYYYDDIDAIRQPNYIARSNIDTAPWAPAYGTMTEETNVANENAYALANRKFMEDQLAFREGIQQSYMRKYNNSTAWQRRVAPITQESTYLK